MMSVLTEYLQYIMDSGAETMSETEITRILGGIMIFVIGTGVIGLWRMSTMLAGLQVA
jgi:hypothetical protein